jgi:hypothetical protein
MCTISPVMYGDPRVVGGCVVGERFGDEHRGVVDQGVEAAEPVQRRSMIWPAMSPATVSRSGSSDGLIVRPLATAGQPR